MTLHPRHHARTMPDKPAYRMTGSGSAITYGELDRVSNQGAQQKSSGGRERRPCGSSPQTEGWMERSTGLSLERSARDVMPRLKGAMG
jgi:acyl-CoA synthetase (AMP-forming)/AMP-acid ligase II